MSRARLLLRPPDHFGAVDDAVLHRPAADKDVFSDGKLRQKLQLLMDEYNALVYRLTRRSGRIRLAKPGHLSFGRLAGTGDDA